MSIVRLRAFAVFVASSLLMLLESFKAPAFSRPVPIPLFQGMKYDLARQRLIHGGWQAYTAGGADMLFLMGETSPDRDLQISLRNDFRKQGWYETLHCYPTGSGACYHLFFDSTGKKIIIETIKDYKSGINAVRHWHECTFAANEFLTEACSTPVN